MRKFRSDGRQVSPNFGRFEVMFLTDTSHFSIDSTEECTAIQLGVDTGKTGPMNIRILAVVVILTPFWSLFEQRQEFKLLQKGRSSRLSGERIDLLNKVGFVWEAQRGGPRRKRRATVLVPDQAKPIEGAGPRRQPSISRRGGLSRGGSILNRPLVRGQPLPVGGVPTFGGPSMLGFNGMPQASPTGVSYQLQVVAVPTYAGFQNPPIAMAPAVSIAPSIFPMAQPVVQPLIQPMSQPMVQPAYPLQLQQAVAQMNAVPQPNQTLSPYHSQSISALQAPPSNAGDFFREEQPRKRRRRTQGSA